MRYFLAFIALACSGQSYPGSIAGAISSEPGMYTVQVSEEPKPIYKGGVNLPYYSPQPNPFEGKTFQLNESGTHSSFDASTCITVTSTPAPRPKVGPPSNTVDLFVVNNCKVKFLVVRVSLKYFDKDGYRIGSDADGAGVLIPGFAVGEKVKKSITLMAGAVGAELRDVVAIK